jgi:hypothetical protein
MAKRSKTKARRRQLVPAALAPGPEAEADQIELKIPEPPRGTPARVGTFFSWQRICRVLLIAGATLWIYGPVLHGGWLWDDDTLIFQNPVIQDPGGILDIWLSPGDLIDYFPLSASAEWLGWQIWGADTLGYHLMNVLLHVCSALLVWRLFSKLGLRLAWLGGLFFAIHPVMVESVAWMAELKNTLSMPPFLLAMCAWIDYEARGKLEDYFLALGLFLIAMLCKSSMVMFPVVILLFAWWKRGRVEWRDLQHTLAFFAVSLADGLMLIAFLRHGVGEETIPLGGILSRIACAGLSTSFYFSKCFFPAALSPIYPQWAIDPPTLVQFLPWPILAGVIGWLWTQRASWGRHALLGLGFFLINLALFTGVRTIAFMRVTWVMDHIIYLPILGLLGLVVAALGQWQTRLTPLGRRWAMGGIAAVAVLLTFVSHRDAKTYLSSETLWIHAIKENPNAWPAYNNLGNALATDGRFGEAKTQYEAALQLNPDYPEAHNNLGIIYARMGRVSDAADQFEDALKLCPGLVSAQNNLDRIKAFRDAALLPK